MKPLRFATVPFYDLDHDELYALLKLRSEVFVVEQDCVYLDQDDKDKRSLHVLGSDEDGILRAYTRLMPLGLSYDDYVSIGRVLNDASIRGHGEGKRIMEYSIAECKKRWPDQAIKISGQVYLDKFYRDLGFKPTGEEYLEDGIPHQAMVYHH